MKLVDTIPGYEYSVKSAVECEVYTPGGSVLGRVAPGVLLSFKASSYVTCFSDDSAEVLLVSSGGPGGAPDDDLTVSRALAAASKAEDASKRAGETYAGTELLAGRAETGASAAGQAAGRAEAAADAAAKSAQDALANQQGAEQAAMDAAQSQVAATSAKTDAEAAKIAAQTSELNAKASADSAATDKAAAEQAKTDALAAQSIAEEQAAIATKAAEDAQAPESIAAQSARPATMLLVKDELMSLLGDATLFDLDTDGQKIIVHTDRLEDDQLAAVTDMLGRFVPQFIEVEQYNHHIEVSWSDISKYAECVTVADLLAVNPDFRNDLTEDGSWVYPLNSFNGSFSEAFRAPAMPFVHADFYLPALTTAENGANWNTYPELETLKIIAPLLRFSSNAFVGSPKLRIVHAYLPEATAVSLMFYTDKSVEKVTGFFPKVTEAPAFLNVSNAARSGPVMTCELKFPKLSNGKNMFNYCRLDKQSTLGILNSIPSHSSGTHMLTIGIHIGCKYDPEVNLALKKADINYEPTVELSEEVTESKGWTLEVQWNGTSTSAASTMAMGTLIYAKVGEIELPDGTTEQVLDWGHYVSRWEERGYEQFRSLESAYRYFGIDA